MLKQLKIKNFRNINNELIISDLNQTNKNITIFSGRNSAGKSNLIRAIKKAIGTDFFSTEDFAFENPNQDIEISFNFDKLEMNNNAYKDFELKIVVKSSNPFVYNLKSNIDYQYNNIYENDLIKKLEEMISVITSSKENLKSFKKIAIAYNSSYNAFKRSRLLLAINLDDESKNIKKLNELLNKNNLLLVSEIFMALKDSIKHNPSLHKLDDFLTIEEEALLVDLSESDKAIYRLMPNLFELVENYFSFEKANNLNYFALSILKDELLFIDEDDYKAKTVNIITDAGGWLQPLLENYNLTKQQLFNLISENKNTEVVEKIKSKILSVFNEFFRIVKFNSNIKDIKMSALQYETHEAIIIRLIDKNNNAFNIEQFGSGLQSFVFLVALMIKDKNANSIFVIEDLINHYSPKTKDKVLKFLQNNIKGKVIYTTNSLTDHERFESNTKLINLDDTPIDTLKELALLKELSETRRQILEMQNEIRSLEINQQQDQSNFDYEDYDALSDQAEKEFIDKINELENEIKHNSLEKEDLLRRLVSSKNQYEELKDNYEILLEREQDLRNSNDTATMTIPVEQPIKTIDEVLKEEEFNEQIEETHKAMINSQRELTKISFDYKMLLEGYNNLQQKVIILNHSLKLKDLEAAKSIQHLNNQLEKSETDYDGIYSKIYLFEQSIEKLEEINNELVNRNQDLELENQKLTIQLDNQSDAKNDEIVYRESQINQKQQLINDLEDKQLELREQLEYIREKNYLLETKVLQTQLLVDKIESSKVILKNNSTQRESVFKNRIQELEKESALLVDGINDLRASNQELEKLINQSKLERENLAFESEQLKKRLVDSNDDLSSVNTNLEQELDIKEAEIKELEDNINQLEKELMTSLMSSKREINNSENTIAKLMDENGKLISENEKINEELKHLKVKASNQEVVSENSKKVIEGYEAEIEALSKLNSELESELDFKTKEETKFLSENDKKIVERDETIKTLNKQIEKLNATINRQETSITKFKDDLTEQKTNLKTERNNSKEQLSELRDQIRQLNAQLTDKSNAYDSLENQIEEFKVEIQTLSNETIESEKLIDETSKNETALKNEIIENNIVIQKQERELIKLSNDINKIKDAQEKARERTNELNSKNKELRSEKSQLSSQVNELTKRLTLLEKDATKYEVENSKLTDEVSTLSAELSLKVGKAQRENLDLVDEINQLNSQIETLTEQINSTEKSNEELNDDLKEFKNNDKQARAEISELNLKVQTLEKQLNNSQKQLIQKDSKNEKLSSDLQKSTELKRENTSLTKQTRELEKQVDLLSKRLLEKDAEAIELQDSLETNNSQVAKQLTESQKVNVELNKQINRLQDQLEKLENQFEAKKTQSDSLKEKQKQLNDEIKKLKNDKRELEKVSKTPTKVVETKTIVDDKEIKRLTTNLDKLQKENDDLKSKQKQLSVELEKAKKAPKTDSKQDANVVNNQVQLLQFKNEELKNRVNRLTEQVKNQQEVLQMNNLLEGLEVDSDKKSRLVLTTTEEAVDFIKWLATKEEILLSEFNYEFGIIPTSKEDINATTTLIKSKPYDQIFIFADYTNESKKIYTSEVFEEMKKELSVSQLKPYYWNMMRNKKQIIDEKIPANRAISFSSLVDKLLSEAKIKHTKDNGKENLNLIKVNFETNEALYKLAKKEYGLDKLIKLLKSN